MNFISFYFVVLSFNLASCQYGYNTPVVSQFGAPVAVSQQTTAVQQQPNGQQMTIVKETFQQPNGASETVVTKTMTQPVVGYGTGYASAGSNYASNGYAVNNYGRKRRGIEEAKSGNPSDPSSQASVMSGRRKRHVSKKILRSIHQHSEQSFSLIKP
jgi:hypothetical protein